MAQGKKKEEKQENIYVDNQLFLDDLVQYKKDVKKAKREGNPRPQIPDSIGQCFLDIAKHRATEHNFINYPFKEDMISDGVENCVQYIDNFNPKISQNPFAYFSQIVYFAFVRRIQREKKHLFVKFQLISDFLQDTDFLTKKKYGDEQTDQNMRTYIETFKVAKLEKKNKKKKASGPLGDLS